MVGHKKDAIEEKISFVYVSIFLHFSTNANPISAEDWQDCLQNNLKWLSRFRIPQ